MQAGDGFVLGGPAAICGGVVVAKAFDPERSLVGETSGGCENSEAEDSSHVFAGLEPRALPWAVFSRPFRAGKKQYGVLGETLGESVVRSPDGAEEQSLGQRPRCQGREKISRAGDDFVLGCPAVICGGVVVAKAFDPERSLVGETSGGYQNSVGRGLVSYFRWVGTQGVALGFVLSPRWGW